MYVEDDMYWANTATIFFVWKKTIVKYVYIYIYIYLYIYMYIYWNNKVIFCTYLLTAREENV